MKQFEVGKTYTSRSSCDSNCIYEWKVIKRTEKTITIVEIIGKHKGTSKRVKIQKSDAAAEFAYPDGRYSMCPLMRAERHL